MDIAQPSVGYSNWLVAHAADIECQGGNANVVRFVV